MKVNEGERMFCMGQNSDKNGPIGNKKSKQIGIHYYAKETPDVLKIASNKERFIRQRKCILICLDVNKEMGSHIILKAKQPKRKIVFHLC